MIIYIGKSEQLMNRLLISTAIIKRIYTVLDTKLVLEKDKDQSLQSKPIKPQLLRGLKVKDTKYVQDTDNFT